MCAAVGTAAAFSSLDEPEILTWLFGGDAPPDPLRVHQAFLRGVLVFVVGIGLLRLGRIRLLGRASVLDILLAFCVGSVLSRAMNGSSAFSTAFAATAALVLAHRALTWLGVRSHRVGQWIKGAAVPPVRDGQALEDNLRHCNVSAADLHEELRLNGNVDDVADVESAFLERNGEISVVRRGGRVSRLSSPTGPPSGSPPSWNRTARSREAPR